MLLLLCQSSVYASVIEESVPVELLIPSEDIYTDTKLDIYFEHSYENNLKF